MSSFLGHRAEPILDSVMWQPVLRIGGIVGSLVGLMALPLGRGVSPKRDLSAFYLITDTGAFVKIALALVVAGLIAMILSLLVPGDME